MKNIWRKIAVVVLVIITLLFNYFANAIPFNGNTTGEISNRFAVPLTPPGFTFAIWGIIYLALSVYSIYPFFYKVDEKLMAKIFPWFALSTLGNIGWIYLWHYEYINWTPLAMLLILISLIRIYQIIGIGKSKRSLSEKVVMEFPFSLYLGWISVASILNLNIFLLNINWDGFGLSMQVWSIVMLVLITLITLFLLFRKRDLVYSLAIMWALNGLIMKPAIDPAIGTTVMVSFFIILVGFIYTGYLVNFNKKFPILLP